MFCLYRYKIAYYLSHAGKDKKRFLLMSLKGLIYAAWILHTDAWHSILYVYVTFKFTKSELFFLKMSLPLLLNFFENNPYLA